MKDLLRKWMGKGATSSSKAAHVHEHHHEPGEEGKAFQVNSDPEPVDEPVGERESGAEGNAFQVNSDPENDDDQPA
jgi:hypothetical protein